MKDNTQSSTPSSQSKGIDSTNPKPRFPLGQILATPGALAAVPPQTILQSLGRHVRGDWGNICEDDRRENEFAIDKYLRILSAYTTPDGTKFWIITEADRSATTVLLPDEY